MSSSNDATDIYQPEDQPNTAAPPFLTGKKKVLLGAGSVLLGASSLAWGLSQSGQQVISSFLHDHDEPVGDASPLATGAERPVPGARLMPTEDVQIAQVDDTPSFKEAFLTAREQVGPGGLFTWKGEVFNTYYREEWSGLSLVQRQEFLKDIGYQPYTELAAQDELSKFEPPQEPVYIETVSDQGERMLCIDVDHDGLVDSVLVQGLDGQTIRYADKQGNQGLDMVYIIDPLTQDVLGSARLDPVFLTVDQVNQQNELLLVESLINQLQQVQPATSQSESGNTIASAPLALTEESIPELQPLVEEMPVQAEEPIVVEDYIPEENSVPEETLTPQAEAIPEAESVPEESMSTEPGGKSKDDEYEEEELTLQEDEQLALEEDEEELTVDDSSSPDNAYENQNEDWDYGNNYNMM